MTARKQRIKGVCRKGAKMRADADKKKKIARYVFLAATVVV